jgi:ribosomal protein L40E
MATNMVLCLRCAAQNPPHENYCLTCGATLPKLAYTMEMVPVERIEGRCLEFTNAAEYVKTGQWSMDEFADFMEATYEKLTKIEQDIREMPIKEEVIEDFEEELEVGLRGVELYNEGMETMMQYIEDENPYHLDTGLQKIYQGNELIIRARVINRERDKKLGSDADLYRQDESMMI